MKRTLVLSFAAACTLLLAGATAFADAGSAGPGELSLEPVPAEPAMSGPDADCQAPSDALAAEAMEGAIFAADKGGSSLVTCTADCGPYADVSCSTSGTCTAVDRNCPGQRGYVECGSTVKYCPICQAVCEEGTYRSLEGGCCGDGLTERTLQQCVDGAWETIGQFCGPPWCGGGPIP